MRRLRLWVKAAGLLCCLMGSVGVAATSSMGGSASVVAVDPMNAVIASVAAMVMGVFVYSVRTRYFN